MNNLNNDTKKSMFSRVMTAIVLVIICVPCLFAGSWYFLALSFAALALAIHEFTNAPAHNHYNLAIHGFIFVMTMATVYWIFIKWNVNAVGWNLDLWRFENGLTSIEVSTIGIATIVSVLFLTSILDKNFTINDATYLFTMIVFVGLSFQAILFLRYFPRFAFATENPPVSDIPWWHASFLIIYVLLGTFMSDIGAYFVGVLFGRNKMNPRISPKKTWEGFAGGVVLSLVMSVSFALIVDRLGYPMLPFMTSKQWYWIVGISVIMPFMANLGDFLFSAIKRNFNLKDYGTLLKGMGGVLDRLDSVLMVSLTVAIIIIFIHNGWSLWV